MWRLAVLLCAPLGVSIPDRGTAAARLAPLLQGASARLASPVPVLTSQG